MFFFLNTCTMLHTSPCVSVCVLQSLSTTALMVWVQCSRAGSRSVSTTTQHHKLDTEGMECFPHPGDLFNMYNLLFFSFIANQLNSVWACWLQMRNWHTSWTHGMSTLAPPFSCSSANERSLKSQQCKHSNCILMIIFRLTSLSRSWWKTSMTTHQTLHRTTLCWRWMR